MTTNRSAKAGSTVSPYDLSQLAKLVEDKNVAGIKKIILANKKKGSWEYGYNDHATTAACEAIKSGNLEMVKAFFDEGEMNPNGRSAQKNFIYYAVEKRSLPIVEYLVSKGLNLKDEEVNGCDIAILTAVEKGFSEIVVYLLSQGANAIACFPGIRYETLLAKAASQDDFITMEALIANGADKVIEASLSLTEEKYSPQIRRYQNALSQNIERSRRIVTKNQEDKEPSPHSFDKLEDLDKERAVLKERLQELQTRYRKIVKNIHDYSVGLDLSPDSLTYLPEDISGMNFCGISVNGRPVTKEMLLKMQKLGIDAAIISLHDLKQVQDLKEEPRVRDTINKQLQIMYNQRGVTVYTNDVVNLVPLWRAAEIGDVTVVEARLKVHSCDPNKSQGSRNLPPLVSAVANGHEEVVKMLLQDARIDKRTFPVALRAAQKSKRESIANLISLAQDVNQLDDKGNALLHYAVQDGNVKAVMDLIKEKGANVNLESTLGTPLQIAARCSRTRSRTGPWGASPNHIEIMKILLNNGADPNFVQNSHTALDAAVNAGNASAVEMLLPITQKKPVKMKSINLGGLEKKEAKTLPWYNSMIFSAYRSHSPEWIEILKLIKKEDKNVDLGVKDDWGNMTLLWEVMANVPKLDADHDPSEFARYYREFNYLMQNHANPNTTCDRHEETAVHAFMKKADLYHIEGGYAKILDKCIVNKFDINAVNKYGETILHIAAAHGNLPAVAYLLSRGAEIHAADNYGRTPLHCAAVDTVTYSIVPHGSPKTAAYLISKGANPRITDKKGETPFALAERLSLEWTKTDSFKGWDAAGQAAFRNELQVVQEAMMTAIDKLHTQKAPEDKKENSSSLSTGSVMSALSQNGYFTDALNQYIESFKSNIPNSTLAQSLKLSTEEVELLEFYRDDVSNKLMDIPVLLNHRVYDLSTLEQLLKENKPDPFTRKFFKWADVSPAQQTARGIENILQAAKAKCEKSLVAKAENNEVAEDKSSTSNNTKDAPVEKPGSKPSNKSSNCVIM